MKNKLHILIMKIKEALFGKLIIIVLCIGQLTGETSIDLNLKKFLKLKESLSAKIAIAL